MSRGLLITMLLLTAGCSARPVVVNGEAEYQRLLAGSRPDEPAARATAGIEPTGLDAPPGGVANLDKLADEREAEQRLAEYRRSQQLRGFETDTFDDRRYRTSSGIISPALPAHEAALPPERRTPLYDDPNGLVGGYITWEDIKKMMAP